MRHFVAAVIVALGIWPSAHAESAASIAVEHAWARASPKGAPNGVAYLTLVNRSPASDRLIGASSPVAENIQIHEERAENGVSKMLLLDTIEVPPGAAVTLKPSVIHLMLRLTEQLQEGKTFPLTLTFEKAGAIEVTVKVGKVGAMDDMSGM